jgi:hypothetical protein
MTHQLTSWRSQPCRPDAPQPHTGHPGQPPSWAHDLFRVSVTIVTLTRNKSQLLASKPGIPDDRPGWAAGNPRHILYGKPANSANRTVMEPQPRHVGQGRSPYPSLPPYPSLQLPLYASRPLSQLVCPVMGMREAKTATVGKQRANRTPRLRGILNKPLNLHDHAIRRTAFLLLILTGVVFWGARDAGLACRGGLFSLPPGPANRAFRFSRDRARFNRAVRGAMALPVYGFPVSGVSRPGGAVCLA